MAMLGIDLSVHDESWGQDGHAAFPGGLEGQLEEPDNWTRRNPFVIPIS